MPFSRKKFVFWFLESLKKRKKINFAIKTSLCPDRIKTCRKRHGDIVINYWNSKTKKFRLKYYAVHEKITPNKIEQPIEFVAELILKQLYSGNRLLTTKKMERFLKFDYRKAMSTRSNHITLHFSNLEYEKLLKKASKKNQEIYHYCKSKLIS